MNGDITSTSYLTSGGGLSTVSYSCQSERADHAACSSTTVGVVACSLDDVQSPRPRQHVDSEHCRHVVTSLSPVPASRAMCPHVTSLLDHVTAHLPRCAAARQPTYENDQLNSTTLGQIADIDESRRHASRWSDSGRRSATLDTGSTTGQPLYGVTGHQWSRVSHRDRAMTTDQTPDKTSTGEHQYIPCEHVSSTPSDESFADGGRSLSRGGRRSVTEGLDGRARSKLNSDDVMCVEQSLGDSKNGATSSPGRCGYDEN